MSANEQEHNRAGQRQAGAADGVPKHDVGESNWLLLL